MKYKKISACCIVLPHLKQKVKVQSSRAIVLPVEFQTIIGSNKRYKGGKLYQLPPEKEKTVGDEEKMNPHENEPQSFGFRAAILYHWATETL